MNGTIHFDNIGQLAEFLINFAGGSATFEVTFKNNRPILTFLGGH